MFLFFVADILKNGIMFGIICLQVLVKPVQCLFSHIIMIWHRISQTISVSEFTKVFTVTEFVPVYRKHQLQPVHK